MPDSPVINFYAATRPGATHSYIPELHYIIVVSKGLTVFLINGRPYLAPDLGHYHYFDKIIFQFYHLPFLLYWLVGKPIKTEVRIDVTTFLLLVCNRIGIRKWISGKGLAIFFNR